MWTRERLRWACQVSFAPTATTRVPTAALAVAVGVHPTTLRRWLRAAGEDLSTLGEPRWTRLAALWSPRPTQLAQEELNADYAREAINTIDSPGSPEAVQWWRQQRWLEPHLVSVVARVPGLQQIVVSRADMSRSAAVRRRGAVEDFQIVETRFHGTLLATKVLHDLANWRIVPDTAWVKRRDSPQQCWADDAPTPNLPAAAREADVYLEPSLTPAPNAPGGARSRRGK